MINAVGSSLVAVAAFGATAALNYAISGLVDWRLAIIFIGGGVVGGLLGGRMAQRLGAKRGALNAVFAGVILLVAIYMLARSIPLVNMPRAAGTRGAGHDLSRLNWACSSSR